MYKIKIKPLSVNVCWQGRRFKSDDYKDYEKELLWKLPKIVISKERKLTLYIKVGYSSKNADIDNFLKPFLDILQKKYGFNDSKIYKLLVEKEDTKKGEEFIEWEII